MSTLTDTHAHLYSFKFDSDRDAMVNRAIAAGVTRIFLPAIDRESHEQMIALANQYPNNCFPMMGLHPCSVKQEDVQQELEQVYTYLKSGKFCAVGEIGIDLYWDKTTLAVQQEAFAQQIDWALEFDLPIAIHSRDAFNECYEIVKAKQNGKLRGVFHCFSDGPEEAQKVVELGGFYLGIGGVLTFKNSTLPAAIENVPMEYLLLETDAPYLAPVPHRGQRNESSYVTHVADKLAEVKRVFLRDVIEQTTQNSIRLFGK
jgi:TatD DNase family protein